MIIKKRNWSIQTRLISIFILTISIIFAVNCAMFLSINRVINKIDQVYMTNVLLNGLTESLSKVQDSMTEYLNTKSTDSIEKYFKAEQDYKDQLEELSNRKAGGDILSTIEDIENLSDTYLSDTENAIQAKRGHIIEKYSVYYEQTSRIYDYINSYIYSLNNSQFKNNSEDYYLLANAFHTQEDFTIFVLLSVAIVNILLTVILTKNIMTPVQENALLMEAHLKDAELKYLQAQINPHFLFNTLNAGAQLAMMEDAGRTYDFIQNMSAFFRYKIKKNGAETKLSDEISLVDNYLYILNVRYTGEIHFEKEIDPAYLNVAVPGMILEPIVENSVTYGINNIDREKVIRLSVFRSGEAICIRVEDNGIGINPEMIELILNGQLPDNPDSNNSNGVGLKNVISRLELFYGRRNILQIRSSGENMGTVVDILIPLPKDGLNHEQNLSNHAS